MRYVELDGTQMTTIQSCHEHIARSMYFPSYYGKNLDALWDMLSTIHEDTHITLSSSVLMLNALDAYGTKILQTFYEADAENDHIIFELV